MKLYKYDVVLKRIIEDDIELVRNWRNSVCIRQYMQFREHITKKQQKQWFNSINNINNFYYLIYYKDEPIGLFNEKNIDWKERTSETGLFIWDERYIDTHIPLMASLMLSQMGFEVFEGKKSFVSVLKSNEKARNYVLNFGYTLLAGEENKDFQRFELTRENFEKKGGKLLKAMDRLHPDKSVLYMLLESNDYKIGIAQHLEKAFEAAPVKVNRKEDEKGIWYYYP
jgi:UDP-4-amino-4,6-dideoxy-N-acetyl-beta-L-altrosamine N-acetyltransferase